METFSALLGPLWGESTGHRWIPLTKVSDADLLHFIWAAPEQTVAQTLETPMIWEPSRSLWRHSNETCKLQSQLNMMQYQPGSLNKLPVPFVLM